ncbi:TPM domain-containing protein [Marnyiella aurantia]|uniref:TPM domain-containing protein n=1 Tax=Marnyiella aurantia TaxID=2758037 RepID=A0A7D7LRV2_9FLAO|nr:TPM domain-containing protein [Marnyiella aurantia]MBA5247774.1 TPM domain-containing protein [Marnyiella aurantia]QMS97355.1 TPM domain-containing protein [Marnyiella aurantia]
MRSASLKFFTVFLICCGWFHTSAQYKIPQKPAVLYPVFDESGILSQNEKDLLNQKLIKFEDSTSTEIEVIIIPTTQGEDINFLAWEFGEKWQIGKKGQDNGIVFLIATEDRTMSIQQGRDVEKYLTASVAGQIIDYVVAPNFKQGMWYEGINRGTSALMEAVQGKYKPVVKKNSEGGGMSVFEIILITFFVLFILSFLFKNRGGGNRNDDDDEILTRRGRRSYPGGFFPFPMGGGGFGGGGGGFGGFGGGGSFGGGGASGGW